MSDPYTRRARRQDRRQAQRERKRKRRFDPMQRAEDFILEPAPRVADLTPERRFDMIESLSRNALLLASRPPGRQLLETVLALPEASALDVGRQIILRRGAGIADQMYIGMQLDDDSYAWVEMTTELAQLQKTFVRTFSTPDPYMITTDAANNLWVTNWGDHRIRKYTSSGALLETSGSGSADTSIQINDQTFNLPTGIAWLPAGLRWPTEWLAVSNAGASVTSGYAYQMYSLVAGPLRVVSGTRHSVPAATGSWAGTMGTAGSSNAHLNTPNGVAVDGNGYLYIADALNHRVQKWLLDLTFSPPERVEEYIGTIGTGTSGTADGQLWTPIGVAIDSNGDIYVSERDGQRISVFNSSWVFQRKWGSFGTGDGQFSGPHGIAFDPLGNLHVVDRGNDRVQVFDRSGNFIMKYGSTGSGDGQFGDPIGIAITGSGVIFVCDFGNDRISVWV